MKIPRAEAIADGYDRTPESSSAAYAQSLWASIRPQQLIPTLVGAFPLMRRAWGRAEVLRSLIPYARLSQEANSLAIEALDDKSYLVRQEACGLLAYALDDKALPALEAAAKHADQRTVEDASAALTAIHSRNHHLYVDRAHSGGVLWQVPFVAGL
jgi:hypothetical protein